MPVKTEPCAKIGCEAEARQSIIMGRHMYSACPEHYPELCRVLGVD